jgi:group I intron endonuclease
MIGIYKILNPNGKVYVGQSINIEKRFIEYKSLSNCKGQKKLYNSFVKYGVNNHLFIIICECELDELNYLERKYQEEYNVIVDGLNLRYTKILDKSGYMSPESIEKMKLSNRKINLNKIWIHRENESKLIKKEDFIMYENDGFVVGQTNEHKEKNRKGQLGRKHNSLTKIKISDAHKNKIVSELTKEKLRVKKIGRFTGQQNPRAKSVCQLDKETLEVIRIFTTAKEASEITKTNRSTICECCKGRRNSSGGYKWCYYNS